MGEYSSKGVGTGGLTTGIIGTSLAGLLALNNGNGGILGGLLGNQDQQEKLNTLMNENTGLKSNAYTNEQLKKTTEEICSLKTEAALQTTKIECIEKQSVLKEEITEGKITNAVLTTTSAITSLQQALACIQSKVDQIASTYVPAQQVSPMPAPFVPPLPPVVETTAADSGTTEKTTNSSSEEGTGEEGQQTGG